jgi:hypothetical protein
MSYEKSCQNCKFHATVTGADRTIQTQCRKEIPKMMAQFIPQGAGQVGVIAQRVPWPVMEKDDWCGLYEPQLN